MRRLNRRPIAVWIHLHEAATWRGVRIVGPVIFDRSNPIRCQYSTGEKCVGWVRLVGYFRPLAGSTARLAKRREDGLL